MKIGIILGSIRDDRLGQVVGDWVAEQAAGRDHDYELVDLKAYDVPLLTSATVPMAAGKTYDDPNVQAWAEKLDTFDGFVFVTPEYNHSVPGAFKNAVDSVGAELSGKAFGLVAYGADGGVRAVEHWRTILANFSSVVVRGQVSLSLFTDVTDGALSLLERREGELSAVFDQVEDMAGRLRG
ncbi:NAD(P)H-dependent oxidoreductase [Nocardioidaceae bacterium]|nr:NAD(P)H-dependent oxidoreductase [Nocardioidaceae bacterium]